MRKVPRCFAALAVIVVLFSSDALACGDKIVVFGRGVRFRSAYATTHPASVLIFMNPGSRLPELDRQYHILSILKLAGHKPVAVDSPEELTQALHEASYDVVLVDLADADSVQRQVGGLAVKPAFLPVVDRDRIDANPRYSCVLRASKKNHELLALVEKVMSSKSKGADSLCTPAGGM